jgi:hypothetical protein
MYFQLDRDKSGSLAMCYGQMVAGPEIVAAHSLGSAAGKCLLEAECCRCYTACLSAVGPPDSVATSPWSPSCSDRSGLDGE